MNEAGLESCQLKLLKMEHYKRPIRSLKVKYFWAKFYSIEPVTLPLRSDRGRPSGS